MENCIFTNVLWRNHCAAAVVEEFDVAARSGGSSDAPTKAEDSWGACLPISALVEEPAVQEWAVQRLLLLMLSPLLPSSIIVCNHNWLIRRCCLRLRHLRSQGLNDLLVDFSCNWGLLSDFFLGEFHTGTEVLDRFGRVYTY